MNFSATVVSGVGVLLSSCGFCISPGLDGPLVSSLTNCKETKKTTSKAHEVVVKIEGKERMVFQKKGQKINTKKINHKTPLEPEKKK